MNIKLDSLGTHLEAMSLSLSFSVNEPLQSLTFDRRSNTVPRRFPAPDPPVCPRVSSPGTPDAPSSAARVPGSFCPHCLFLHLVQK